MRLLDSYGNFFRWNLRVGHPFSFNYISPPFRGLKTVMNAKENTIWLWMWLSHFFLISFVLPDKYFHSFYKLYKLRRKFFKFKKNRLCLDLSINIFASYDFCDISIYGFFNKVEKLQHHDGCDNKIFLVYLVCDVWLLYTYTALTRTNPRTRTHIFRSAEAKGWRRKAGPRSIMHYRLEADTWW